MSSDDGTLRTFATGAIRDTATDKLDYEGFFDPLVLRRYAEYMHEHRKQSDGELRDSDNWQKGMPIDEYMKSLSRHGIDAWVAHREGRVDQVLLCAMLFNIMGVLHEDLKSPSRDDSLEDVSDDDLMEECGLRGWGVRF